MSGATVVQTREVVQVVVGDQRWALPLDAVERVVAIVAMAALPDSPAGVRGAINVHGEPVAVLDLDVRLGRPARDRGVAGRLVLLRTPRRRVAVPVDDVLGVVALDPATVGPHPLPGPIAGVAALDDGVLLIADVGAFLSAAEDAALAAVLEATPT